MDLELNRVDYTIVGITSSKCMKILPVPDTKEQQKVAVVDNDGILQLFSIKKQEVQLHFRTLPGPKITSLQLGGVEDSLQDKIFIASENEIRGYNKKGKLFVSFDTNLTEPITSMFVHGNDLFVCGKHVYSHYRDCKDLGSYLCGDTIVDVIALPNEKTHRLTSLIACEGRMIRAIEHSRVTYSIEVENSPTVLHVYELHKQKYVLFGTVDGRVGTLNLEKNCGAASWLLSIVGSSISCLESYDLTRDDVKELIVGRQDGTIQVYTFNITDKEDSPILIYTHNCNESVTAIQGGIVGGEGFVEMLVATYTGRIFGLTTESIDEQIAGDGYKTSTFTLGGDTSQRMFKLKSDVEELEHKVTKERERYQLATQSYSDGVSAIPLISIKDSMILTKSDASYTLSIEIPTAIDNVLLQSDVAVSLLDLQQNSAVVSFSESDEAASCWELYTVWSQNGNFLLATYRCQVNTNRIEVKVRTIEGQSGKLQAFITPLIQPKCCQVRQYDIKPLSLHIRTHAVEQYRPFNALSLKGPFSLAEVHSWIFQCFPEVPEKPNFTEKNVLYFQSTFIDTVVQCTYSKGEAEFKSDNVSTISILKEYLTKEATKKMIKIDISYSVNESTIKHTLKLLHPILLQHIELTKKIQLITALNELEVNEEETGKYLSTKYKDLIKNEKSLSAMYSSQPSYLDRLFGLVMDLYVDYNKFKGVNIKPKIPQLTEILDNYDCEKLQLFFYA